MFNKYILDSDTFQNFDKRRAIRKQLARQMILDTTYLKIERFILRFLFFAVLIFCISHYLAYDHLHLFHTHG
jgi:hypothetical protein